MKKLILIVTFIAISMSSCLKDNRYINFAGAGNILNMPMSGLANFSSDAITAADTVVTTFAVDYATTNANPAITVTLYVDTALVAQYNAANPGVTYLVMPANAYVLTPTVSIAAGAQYAYHTVTVYKNLLDPAKSYMLPVAIKGGGNVPVSANLGVHYYHVIGNDFAGSYEHFYTRWSNGDSTTTASNPRSDLGPTVITPVSPTEITVTTGYYTAPHYDITFTKTISSAGVATYSNWKITFLAADVASSTQWGANITVVDGPKFRPLHFNFDPAAQYTYAQSLQLFRFYFQTSSRAIIDDYTHN
jgi:hypothetical protein